MMKSRMPQSEYPMNIFYIIGVIVVILFVASFLGLHALTNNLESRFQIGWEVERLS